MVLLFDFFFLFYEESLGRNWSLLNPALVMRSDVSVGDLQERFDFGGGSSDVVG